MLLLCFYLLLLIILYLVVVSKYSSVMNATTQFVFSWVSCKFISLLTLLLWMNLGCTKFFTEVLGYYCCKCFLSWFDILQSIRNCKQFKLEKKELTFFLVVHSPNNSINSNKSYSKINNKARLYKAWSSVSNSSLDFGGGSSSCCSCCCCSCCSCCDRGKTK